MRSLQPVPDSPPRAVLYLRQSVSREDSISLEIQETSGRAYCEQRGYVVVAVLADPGITGRTWNRAAVQKTMSMVEAGEADVIVLWKWSRLSRSRKDWAVAVDKVESLGGRIESSTEQVDVTTATGRFARGMLAEMAAFESDRIGEVWREVHESRFARGLVPNGNRRFGYVFDHEGGVHRPDPVEGPALVAAYEKAAAGEPLGEIARWLNGRGMRTVKGGPFEQSAVRTMLDAGFGAGIITWRGRTAPGAHEALVPPELWQAYNDRRAMTRTEPPRRRSSPYLLSGLVRCGRCEKNMIGGPNANFGPKFVCGTRKRFGRGEDGCDSGSVQMRFVEEAVLEWLRELADDVRDAADVEERSMAGRVSAAGDVRRLTDQLARLDESLQRLTVQLAEGLVPVEAYVPARDELLERRAVLEDQLEDAGRTVRRLQVSPVDSARGLLAEWDVLPVPVRRAILGELVARVMVWTREPRGGDGQGPKSRAVIRVEPNF